MNKLRDAILSNTDVMGKINTPLPHCEHHYGSESHQIYVGKNP